MSIRSWHLAGAVRVTALLAATLVLCSTLTAYRARARGDELLQDAGTAMFFYARAQHIDAPRTLILNGVPLRLLSGSTKDSPAALLGSFRARCKRVAARVDSDQRIQKTQRAQLSVLPAFDGVLQRSTPRGGYLACLDAGGPLSLRAFADRVRNFAQNGDLAAIGNLRFVWARTERGTTSYVALSTQGSVPLYAMFPSRGDAPGADHPSLPRPAGTRRTLSAWQENQAPMLATYAASVAPDVLLSRYRAQLEGAGFSVRELSSDREGHSALLFSRGADLAAAVLSHDRHGGARVTLSRLR